MVVWHDAVDEESGKWARTILLRVGDRRGDGCDGSGEYGDGIVEFRVIHQADG